MTLHCITTFNIHSWIDYIQHSSRREATAPTTRHNLERETRLRLYIRLLIHIKTQKRDLFDTLFESRYLMTEYNR